MKRAKYIVILIVMAFISTNCSRSPVDVAAETAEKVISDTEFALEKSEYIHLKGLQIIDFKNLENRQSAGYYFARTKSRAPMKMSVEFGSSSDIPFEISIDGNIVFKSSFTGEREFSWNEIAYNLFKFQDYFHIPFDAGECEILIKSKSDFAGKIYLREITEAEAPTKIEFGEWELAFAASENPDNVNWEKQKFSPQDVISRPEGRAYTREAYNEWTYANGATMLGMMNLFNYTKNDALLRYVEQFCDFTLQNYNELKRQYFENNALRVANYRMFRKAMLDDTGAPALPFEEILRETKDHKYLPIVEEMADYVLHSQQRLDDGTLCRPEPEKWTVWADDLFVSQQLLMREYARTGRSEFIEDVILQIRNIHKYLWDEEFKLHKHAWFDFEQKQSAVFWSRANGWMMWTISDALLFIPKDNPAYLEILNIYQKSIEGIIRYQAESGRWHQVLTNPESFEETSSSAMFTLAIARGVQNSWLDTSYRTNALRGWKGIEAKIENGVVKDICRGTGVGYDEKFYMERERFDNDPRGLGAVITAAVEVQKLIDVK